jgi:hypothetical protein
MKIFILFWAAMIFASIAWYGFLFFYIGIKGGWEILRMTRTLGERKSETDPRA